MKEKNKTIAGIVLYNPNLSRLKQNIDAVSVQVKYIIIYDNGSKNLSDIEDLIKQYGTKIIFISNKDNCGIAHALNIIAMKAIELHYEYLLTLDQDTVIKNNLVRIYSKYIDKKKFGQLCCGYEDVNVPGVFKNLNTSVNKFDLDMVDRCITSGTLINLHALKLVGGFDENLFIDEVDNEISYLLKYNSFPTYRINFIGMEHELGKIQIEKIIGKKISISNYSPFRRYYITRNRVIVSKRYKKEEPLIDSFIVPIKEVAIILLFEKEKRCKIASIFKGLFDGLKEDTERKKYL